MSIKYRRSIHINHQLNRETSRSLLTFCIFLKHEFKKPLENVTGCKSIGVFSVLYLNLRAANSVRLAPFFNVVCPRARAGRHCCVDLSPRRTAADVLCMRGFASYNDMSELGSLPEVNLSCALINTDMMLFSHPKILELTI